MMEQVEPSHVRAMARGPERSTAEVRYETTFVWHVCLHFLAVAAQSNVWRCLVVTLPVFAKPNTSHREQHNFSNMRQQI